MTINCAGLDGAHIEGLKSLGGRKAREDCLNIIVNYLKLNEEDPQKARNYFLAESAKIPNFGRDFLGVDGLEDGVECYSPNIDRFMMVDPYGEGDPQMKPGEFKVFLRTGATSEWECGGPDKEGYTQVGEKLSTLEEPTKYFPGFKCIREDVDRELRDIYTEMGFDIPKRSE